MSVYLDMLRQAMEDLPAMLAETDKWESKLVNYHPPTVERLWRPYNGFRLSLHRIYPCDNPLKHVHPWASSVRILSGQYEMDIGTVFPSAMEDGEWDYAYSARFLLAAGSEYDMSGPKQIWHSVKPIGGPSISLMIMGEPWAFPHPSIKEQPQPGKLSELEPAVKLGLLAEVATILGVK